MQIFFFPLQSYSYNMCMAFTIPEMNPRVMVLDLSIRVSFYEQFDRNEKKKKTFHEMTLAFLRAEQKFKCTDAYAKCLESDTEQRLF